MTSRQVKKELYKSLTKDINHWEIQEHVAINNEAGIIMWIANGFLFFKPYHDSLELGFINKVKLYIWLKNAHRMQIINKVK